MFAILPPYSCIALISLADSAVPFWIMSLTMVDEPGSKVSIHVNVGNISSLSPNVAFVCLEAVELRHWVSTCSLSEITTKP